MSRLYRVNVSIDKPEPGRETAIAEALLDFWGFEDLIAAADGLVSEAEGSLVGGRTEDEFARELAHCVWAANGCFCKVIASMTYLEDLPIEEYVFATQGEYDRWLNTPGHDRAVSS